MLSLLQTVRLPGAVVMGAYESPLSSPRLNGPRQTLIFGGAARLLRGSESSGN
jgi:hypothetical protein